MRETGFYWVKIKDKWEIAEWCGSYWIIGGVRTAFSDTNFTTIKETRIPEPE